MLKSLDEIITSVQRENKKKIAVAAAADEEIIKVLKEAEAMNLAEFILIGNASEINNLLRTKNVTTSAEIIDEPDNQKGANLAVGLVREGSAQAVMKGFLHTNVFMRAVLDKVYGLNTGKLISQVSVIDNPQNTGLQLITDGVISIEPDLEIKKKILENAVELAHKLGYECPKVALLSAVEVINPAMQDTVDAAILCKMNDRGQIKGCILDGPLAMDNALSLEAAKHKGIKSQVAGAADILLVPNIQTGNVLIKALTYYAKKEMASAMMGASAPIIMTSRTDSVRNKLLSIALAVYLSM